VRVRRKSGSRTRVRAHTTPVQALLDDPATAEREHELPHLGRMPLGQAIDMIYTSDVFLHRWDLAWATGQDETLDPDKCAEMLEGMLPPAMSGSQAVPRFHRAVSSSPRRPLRSAGASTSTQ
jgi:hypothetical protein